MHRHALNVPFHHRDIASLAGARWSPEHRLWIYHGEKLPEELVSYAPRPFSWADRINRELNGLGCPIIPGKHTLTPRPHQKEGIQTIKDAFKAGSPGFLLADEVGLGKTLTAWDAIKDIAPTGASVAIVSPLSVIGNWVDTLMDRGTRGQDIVLMNYEKLRLFFDVDNAPKNKDGSTRKIFKGRTLKGVAKYGEMETVDFLILDESHRIRNIAAARSKFAMRLCEKAKFVIWMSGTPGQTPLELAYLLPILQFRTEGRWNGKCTAEDLEQWAAKNKLRITRGDYGKWEWVVDEDENQRLSRVLLEGGKTRVALRRVPNAIVGWPELQRILQPIELDDDDMTKYRQSWQELRAAVLGTPVEKRKLANSQALVAMIRFRQKASLLKVPYTADAAEDIVSNGHQVAISCEFLDTVRALEEEFAKRHIKTVKVTGEILDPAARQAAMVKFNQCEAQVILFTVTEGINLQEGAILQKDKPRTQIDHDIRWSGIAMHQVDGRCHRNGKFARVIWSYIKDTVEEGVVQRVLVRLKGIETLTGDDRQLAKELEDQLLAQATK